MFLYVFADAFEQLLYKATQPAISSPSPRDVENCGRKRHYPMRHQAEDVVKRTVEQNPHYSANLHSYTCPNCLANGKKAWLVGHQQIN